VLGLGIALAVSACLMAIALQSAAGLWLGWFTLIPLFLSIRVLSPLRAFFAGAFWGLCLFVFSTASGSAPFAPNVWSALLLGLVPGAYAFLGARLTRQKGFSPLLLGLGWIAVELALQPLGLRYGLLAATQGSGLVVRTMGYLAGYVMVAFIVAYVNAMLLTMLRDVCVVVLRSPLVAGLSGTVKRLFPIDLPAQFFLLLGPSRPRAPPLG
jgi:apolipoprotein N-acyltransferase